MRTEMSTGSAAFDQPYGTWLLVPALHSELSQASVCVMGTGMKAKHTGRTDNGWLGYVTIFVPGFGWKGKWHSSLSQDCFISSIAAQQAAECCSPMTAANSSSPLHLSLLRFVEIKPYVVPKLLRVLHTS